MVTRPSYSVRTLAERWQCSQGLVRKIISQGKLQASNLGQLIRISADEVDRYEGNTIPHVAPAPVQERPPPSAAPAATTTTHYVVNQRWPDWPQAMKRRTAAAYLDLSEAAFEREVFTGRLPASFILGGREHWRRDALDKALGVLTGDFEDPNVVPEYRRKLRERLARDHAEREMK